MTAQFTDDPRTLTDANLHERLEVLADEERQCALRVLAHLREVERRMLYAKAGYRSLFEYCIVRLKYSEGGAQRRISAMRLLKSHPSITAPLREGTLSLSVACMSNTFFRRHPALSREAKEQFLKNVQGKSRRDVEVEMRQCAGLSEPEIVERMAVTRELRDKLEQVKHLLRFSSAMSLNELVEKMADQIINKKNRSMERSPSDAKGSPTPASTRHIPVAVKSVVWRRDGGQCTFVEAHTNRRCTARHALQYDHKVPFGFGGANTADNIRLLCPAHNRLQAVEIFGNQTMQDFLPSLK